MPRRSSSATSSTSSHAVTRQEVMTALDAATGKERWRSGYAAAYTPSQPTRVHGPGPKATPLFLDGKLFTQGISGIVSAFDAASGKPHVADARARRASLLQRGVITGRRTRSHAGPSGELRAVDGVRCPRRKGQVGCR